MKTISDLPVDLVSEILCRVPLKSTKAVRLTCKTWDNLSKTSSFRKMHMRNDAAREQGETRMVVTMDSTLYLISVVVANVDHPTTEIKGQLTCLDKQVQHVYYCDGLMLCVMKDDFNLLVWNPYLGQTRWIKPSSYPQRRGHGWYSYTYALGYDHKKKRCHKILRFRDDLSPNSRVWYEIYDFDCNLWRTLDVGTPDSFIHHRNGVPLVGNTYWLANLRKAGYSRSDSLICFDFTSETFGPSLSLPFPSMVDRGLLLLLSSLKGDKLSLLLNFTQPSELEVWVTTMIDPNNVLWSMFFKVDTGLTAMIGYSPSSGFFIDEEKKVVMVFDKRHGTRHLLIIIGEAGFIREVNVDSLVEHANSGFIEHVNVCFYGPSLAQLQIK